MRQNAALCGNRLHRINPKQYFCTQEDYPGKYNENLHYYPSCQKMNFDKYFQKITINHEAEKVNLISNIFINDKISEEDTGIEQTNMKHVQVK